MKSLFMALGRRMPESPSDVFKTCMECGNPELEIINEHVLCRLCRWNSIDDGPPTVVDALLDMAMRLDWDAPVPAALGLAT